MEMGLLTDSPGGWRRLPKRLGGGYCRLQMPLRLALAVRGTVAGHRLGALEGGTSPPSNAPLGRGPGMSDGDGAGHGPRRRVGQRGTMRTCRPMYCRDT